MPGQVQSGRTLAHRTHPITPAIAGDEISARIADERHVEAAQRGNNVAPQAGLV